MEKNINYYEILKVSKNASNKEIKSSYKALAKKYHPDLYVGDKVFAEKKMKEINEAYAILSDPIKKATYDSYFHTESEPIKYSASSEKTATSQVKENVFTPESQRSFTKFLAHKFNHLDKNRQIQIFILILVVFLALLLINLLQVQYYLAPSDSSNLNNKNTIQNENSNSTSPSFPENSLQEPTDFEVLDDLFYDLFETYEQEFYDSYNYTNQNLF